VKPGVTVQTDDDCLELMPGCFSKLGRGHPEPVVTAIQRREGGSAALAAASVAPANTERRQRRERNNRGGALDVMQVYMRRPVQL